MKNILKKFNDGEYLVKMIEPDLWQFVPKFLWFAIVLIYAAGLGYLFYEFKPGPLLTYTILGSSAVLLLWYMRFVKIRLSTYLLVTSNRLIYVKYHGLLRKDVIELHYNQFKTVSCHFNGLFSSLLRIGKIVIDRGGLKENIVLEHVYHPQTVQDLIMKLQREYTFVRQFGDVTGTGNTISSMGGYLSARDLMLFLHKFLSIEERKYMSTLSNEQGGSGFSHPRLASVAPIEQPTDEEYGMEQK